MQRAIAILPQVSMYPRAQADAHTADASVMGADEAIVKLGAKPSLWGSWRTPRAVGCWG